MENLLNENSGILKAFTEDLEKLNFLSWYQKATPEDLVMAMKNNAKKLDELLRKYKRELELMKIFERLSTTPPALMYPVDRGELLRFELEKYPESKNGKEMKTWHFAE